MEENVRAGTRGKDVNEARKEDVVERQKLLVAAERPRETSMFSEQMDCTGDFRSRQGPKSAVEKLKNARG